MSNETALGGGQFMCLTCSVPLYHNYTSLSPVDGLKQKSDDRSFSYNYSDLFIESVLCDRRGIHRVKQLAWVPCIHCMNELEITVLMSNNIPQVVDLKSNNIFYYSILMLIIGNLPFEAIY